MIISIVNQKGGVGKTTLALNLSYALSKLGKKVLLIDLDPQASLSSIFGLDKDNKGIYEVLLGEEEIRNVVIKTDLGFDFIPSSINLAAFEVLFASKIGREVMLRKKLEGVDGYDYILIDTQPSLGLLTVNALSASNYALIPISCQYLSIKGFELLLQTIREVRENVNRELEIMGVVPTFYDPRTRHSREMLEYIKREIGRYFKIFPPIKRSVRFDDSSFKGKPIFFFSDKSSLSISKTFLKIAREVISIGETSWNRGPC